MKPIYVIAGALILILVVIISVEVGQKEIESEEDEKILIKNIPIDGISQLSCTDNWLCCEVGTYACQDNNAMMCLDTDNDGCGEWILDNACGSKKVCMDTRCELVFGCQPEPDPEHTRKYCNCETICGPSLGVTYCLGAGYYTTCVEEQGDCLTDDHNQCCPVWGERQTCPGDCPMGLNNCEGI